MTTERSIEFWLKPKSPSNWHSDSLIYSFPPVQERGIEITSVKNSDRTLTVSVKGIATSPIELSASVPHCTSVGLFVVIAWSPTRISLSLNGKKTKQLDISV